MVLQFWISMSIAVMGLRGSKGLEPVTSKDIGYRVLSKGGLAIIIVRQIMAGAILGFGQIPTTADLFARQLTLRPGHTKIP